jgi:hypothetical protein
MVSLRKRIYLSFLVFVGHIYTFLLGLFTRKPSPGFGLCKSNFPKISIASAVIVVMHTRCGYATEFGRYFGKLTLPPIFFVGCPKFWWTNRESAKIVWPWASSLVPATYSHPNTLKPLVISATRNFVVCSRKFGTAHKKSGVHFTNGSGPIGVKESIVVIKKTLVRQAPQPNIAVLMWTSRSGSIHTDPILRWNSSK